MPVRSFTASESSRLLFPGSQVNYKDAVTLAVLVRPGANQNPSKARPGAAGVFESLVSSEVLAGYGTWGEWGTAFSPAVHFEVDDGSISDASSNIGTEPENWVLLVTTRGSGTSVKPVFYKFNPVTSAWTKAEGVTTTQPTKETALLDIGGGGDGYYFTGRVAAAGRWNRALTETEVHSLGYRLTEWSATTPGFFVMLNQSSVTETVKDLSTNEVSQSGRTATAVVAEEPPIPYFAPAYVGRSVTAYATRTTISLPRPEGAKEGDLLVARVYLELTTASVAGSGWTLKETGKQGTSYQQAILTRIDNGEAGPFTFTWDGTSHGCEGDLFAYRGVDPTTPVNVVAGKVNTSAKAMACAAVTTTVPNTTVLTLAVESVGQAATQPAGQIERVDDEPNESGLHAADGTAAAKGTVAESSYTLGSAATSVTATIALAPIAHVVQGKASIAGTSTLSAKGVRTRTGKATIAGTSTITAKGQKASSATTWTGKASVVGSSSIVARGVNPQEGAASRENRKPPLDLDVEVETTHGTFRLASDDKHAKNRPTGISFTTERTNGFGTASFSLARDIFRDYPDINLLDTLRFVSKDGAVAYEGRLHSNPRSNSPSSQISVALVGWMTYLKSRKMSALIIDRRLTGWQEPTIQRKSNIVTLGYRYEGSMSTAAHGTANGLGAAVLLTFQTFDAVYKELGEAWIYAGGEDIGSLRFDYARLEGSIPANVGWHGFGYLSADDVASSFDPSTEFHTENFNNGFVNATRPGRKYGLVSFSYTTEATVGTFANTMAFVNPRIVGTHGIPSVGASPNEGYQISDIIKYIIRTYYPKINTAGIKTNPFAVQQATWHDSPNYGYEAIQELNNLTLWETNVWENREFCFEAADLTKNDWCIRTNEDGVSVNFQGDSIENFANGVTVSYEDFYGVTHTLTPDSHPELQDPSLNNPATEQGENLWVDAEVSWPTSEAEALQFGRAYLAEYNRPKRPGQFTVAGGYIKDAAGHWHQGWKVRCSESIGVMDHPDDEPRLITATSWDAESETLTITVDAPPQTIEALIARNALERTARNM